MKLYLQDMTSLGIWVILQYRNNLSNLRIRLKFEGFSYYVYLYLKWKLCYNRKIMKIL
jgi:hypothetical protein